MSFPKLYFAHVYSKYWKIAHLRTTKLLRSVENYPFLRAPLWLLMYRCPLCPSVAAGDGSGTASRKKQTAVILVAV